MSRPRSFTLPLLLLAFAIAPVASQDAPEKPAAEKPASEEPAAEDAKTPAQAFKAALREWNALDKRLTELKQQYAAAEPGARAEIKSQYEELVDQSTQLLPTLKEAGI